MVICSRCGKALPKVPCYPGGAVKERGQFQCWQCFFAGKNLTPPRPYVASPFAHCLERVGELEAWLWVAALETAGEEREGTVVAEAAGGPLERSRQKVAA